MTTGSEDSAVFRVLRAKVPAEADSLAALARTLAPDERAVAERLRAGGPRERFVTGRAAVRRVLAAQMGGAPGEVPLGSTPGGKLRVAGVQTVPIHVSVSHSGRMVLVAIAGQSVGVDVERMRPRRDVLALAARFFSATERAWVEATSGPDRLLRFLEIWTAKEAVLKGTGAGLPGLLDTEVLVAPDGRVSGAWVAGERWEPRSLELDEGYVGAVAAVRVPERIEVGEI